jgi:hypothetical protein
MLCPWLLFKVYTRKPSHEIHFCIYCKNVVEDIVHYIPQYVLLSPVWENAFQINFREQMGFLLNWYSDSFPIMKDVLIRTLSVLGDSILLKIF